MPTHTIKLGNIEGNFVTNVVPKDTDENIISCCFFYMKEAEDKYTDTLTNLIQNFKTNIFQNSNHKIRLYYDISTKEFIEKKFSNIPYLQLYYYHFPQFFSKKNNRHYGFIGTLIRYFPLFSIVKHQAKKCWILDIDVKLGQYNYNIIKYIENNPDIQFFHKTRLNYFSDRIISIQDRADFSMISSFIYQRKPISSDVLSRFLNEDLLDKKNNIYSQYLKTLINLLQKRKELNMWYKERIDKTMIPFQYGVDEFFINRDFFHYYRDNKIPIYTSFFHTDIFTGIKMHAELLKLNDNKISDNLKEYMNKVYAIIDPNIKINSIDEYYSLMSSDTNVDRRNTRRFEINICKNYNFKKYFNRLNHKTINMPYYIYQKVKLSFKYCFLKEMPILKYVDQKYNEITRIPFK